MKLLRWLCFVLVIIGAINWGLVGLFHFDFVAFLLGHMTMLSRVVYTVVGAAGIILLLLKVKD